MGKQVDIIIAEDDAVVARMQKFNLDKLISRPPVLCVDGQKALDYLDSRKKQSHPVLVILDLNMPVMNGWEFLDACAKKPWVENVFVVVVTSSLFKEDRIKALKYDQVIGYFVKPLKRDDFRKILTLPEIKDFFLNEFRQDQ